MKIKKVRIHAYINTYTHAYTYKHHSQDRCAQRQSLNFEEQKALFIRLTQRSDIIPEVCAWCGVWFGGVWLGVVAVHMCGVMVRWCYRGVWFRGREVRRCVRGVME